MKGLSWIVYLLLSVQKTIMRRFHNTKICRLISSPLPDLPVPAEQNYPKLRNSEQFFVERELRSDLVATFHTPFLSNDVVYEPSLQPDSPLASDHPTTISPYDKLLLDTSNITESSNCNAALPFANSLYSGTLQPSVSNYLKESTQLTWCPESIHGIVDYPIDVNAADKQSQRNPVVNSDDINKKKESDVADILNPNWVEVLDITNTESQVVYSSNQTSTNYSIHHPESHLSLPSPFGERGIVNNPSSANAAPAKPRMRWTQELHERFIEAINQLGGSEKATPKGILKLMKVEGLTIYQVKSHLQKYRTTRYKPESSEGTSERKISQNEEMSSLDLKTGMGITEALRLQLEVQKQLHEQLEIQRKLQLQIDEHGRFIQMIIEKQCKDINPMKASANLEDSTTQFSDLIYSIDNEEISQHSHSETGNSFLHSPNLAEDNSQRQIGDKENMRKPNTEIKCSVAGNSHSSPRSSV